MQLISLAAHIERFQLGDAGPGIGFCGGCRVGVVRPRANAGRGTRRSANVAASVGHIPSAFIITGPNIASQDLLFEQLSEALQRPSASKFVRLRSSEATTLKAALKKTIRDATAATSSEDDDEGLQVESGQEVCFVKTRLISAY